MTIRWIVRLLLATLSFALALGALELVLRATQDDPRPRSSGGFWQTGVDTFGTWHRPNASYTHRSRCFRVDYTTNSVGARDVERTRRAGSPRTIVLGDSFLEGWGVPDGARLSDRLQAATGIEHLNFAMAHFSPYQSYLVYRDLAKDFDHDTVLVSVTPENDFVDLSRARATREAGYAHAWRPYLERDGEQFVHVDLVEGSLHRWLRRHTYGYHALSGLFAADDGGDASRSPTRTGRARDAAPRHSSFWDFPDKGLLVLLRSLELLVEEAEGRRVIVLLVPAEDDLLRQREEGSATTPLAAALAPLAERDNVTIVDLCPPMAALPDEPASFVFPCDYHWNARGHEAAATILLQSYP